MGIFVITFFLQQFHERVKPQLDFWVMALGSGFHPGALYQSSRRAWTLARIAVGLTLGFHGTIGMGQGTPDYEVKAAFLLNFPNYVQWPNAVFADTTTPIVIGFSSESKVHEALVKIIKIRPPQNRAIVTKVIATDAESTRCHIFFVSESDLPRFQNLLKNLENTNVLSVGENDDFLNRGGIINLALRDRKIALEVNLTAAHKANIKISSKLLRVAAVVKGKAN